MSVDLKFKKNGVELISLSRIEELVMYLDPERAEQWKPYSMSDLVDAMNSVEEDISGAREKLENFQTVLCSKITMSGDDAVDLAEQQSYWKHRLEELITLLAYMEILYRIFNTNDWKDDKEQETRIEYTYS
ncbi:MAG: hypothetical protein LUD51_00605 [Clostridia bacterium]|nr:hypothetical protein [Clostridia bacterium]